jgi:hypothetical protein
MRIRRSVIAEHNMHGVPGAEDLQTAANARDGGRCLRSTALRVMAGRKAMAGAAAAEVACLAAASE